MIRRLKFFWWNHWLKIVIALWVVIILYIPFRALSSIDSYQRSYMMAWLSTMGLQATIHSVIFVALLYWLHYGGGFQKMKKSPLKGELATVRWEDVIGMEEAKQEAWEVVQLIKDRAMVKRMGGQFLKGFLMIGPPGCGKTYLAKAIATECGVPFLSMSASEFVEVFVGVGASRVRQLFKNARRLAYAYGGCVIFIDEIDAIGRKRVFSAFGGTEETNSTQNQLLAQMDGLGEKNENIVVIAATNAAEEVIDEALLRPGRFDRKVYVGRPGMEDREKLFRYYLSKIKYDPAIDIGRFGRKAVLKSPADIASIVKEAVLIAARYKQDMVATQHLSEAIERIDLGLKHKRKMTDRERRMTAYHETGHLIVLYILHPTDDVFKASIIPRRETLGVVHHQPREEMYTQDRNKLLADIKVALAGFVAEKIKFNVTSDGVSADFKKATILAHTMVWKLGMGQNGYIGDYTAIPNEQLSEEIKRKLNEETQRIVESCLKEVEELLKSEQELLDRFADELLKHEELDYDEIEAIFKEYGKTNIHSVLKKDGK